MTSNMRIKGESAPPGEAHISMLPAVLVTGTLFAVGLAVTLANSFVVLGVMGAVGVTALSFRRPIWVLWGSIFTLIVFPTYIRIPIVPGLPPITVSLALLGVLFGVLLLKAVLSHGGSPCGPRGRRFRVAFVVFGTVLLLSLVDPRTVTNSVDFWIKVIVVPWLLGYAMLRLVHDAADLDRLFKIAIAGSLIAVAYAIGEFMSGTNILHEIFLRQGEERDWYWQGEDFERVGSLHRTYALFTNPIEFGALMSMVYPYPLLRASYARTRIAQLAWATATLLIVIGAVLSFSRGPIVALVVTALGLAWIVKPLRKLVLASALVGALALVAAWPMVGEKLEQRVADVDNVTLRLKLFTIAWNMALDHPVLGVGFANFPQYQVETVRKHRINMVVEPNAERVHTSENLYLQLAAETGAVGLAALGMLLVAYFALAAWLYRRAPPSSLRTLVLASVMAVVAYLVNGLTVVSYQQYVITLIAGFAFVAPIVLERRLLRESK